MIAQLRGTLIESTPQKLIIDVGGVGYEVISSLETYQKLPDVGETLEIEIHTHVREDDISLYGFLDPREKILFKKLIRINGVGPRLAINILSGISTDDFIVALRTEDLLRITAIPGVGKKTGERILLDLKDKVIDLISDTESRATETEGELSIRDDLLSVLQNLGYKRPQAERALREIDLPEDITLQDAVRQTLRHLGDNAGRRTEMRN